MTKLIDSLCVAKVAVNRNKVRARKPVRVVDSAFPIDKTKLRKIKSYLRNNPDAGIQEAIDEAYYIVTGSDYDSDKSKYAIWLEDFDVMALGKMWPNEDQYESEILYIPDNGDRLVSVPWTLTDGPESLMIIPYELAEAVGVDYEEVYPGFYYVDSIDSSTEDIGESVEDLKEWVDGLESYEDTDNYYKGITPEMAWEPITKLFKGSGKKPAEDSTSKVSDAFIPMDPDRLKPNRDFYRKMSTLNSLIRDFDLDKGDLSKALRTLKQLYDESKSSGGPDAREEEIIARESYRTLDDHGFLDKEPSQVSDAAYNPKFEKLRKVLSDTTIVEELSQYMSSDELEEFADTLTRNFDIDLEEVEDSAK